MLSERDCLAETGKFARRQGCFFSGDGARLLIYSHKVRGMCVVGTSPRPQRQKSMTRIGLHVLKSAACLMDVLSLRMIYAFAVRRWKWSDRWLISHPRTGVWFELQYRKILG